MFPDVSSRCESVSGGMLFSEVLAAQLHTARDAPGCLCSESLTAVILESYKPN